MAQATKVENDDEGWGSVGGRKEDLRDEEDRYNGIKGGDEHDEEEKDGGGRGGAGGVGVGRCHR